MLAYTFRLCFFSGDYLHTGDIVLSPFLNQHLRVVDSSRNVGHAVQAYLDPFLWGKFFIVAVTVVATVGGAAGRDGGRGGGFEILTQRINELGI